MRAFLPPLGNEAEQENQGHRRIEETGAQGEVHHPAAQRYNDGEDEEDDIHFSSGHAKNVAAQGTTSTMEATTQEEEPVLPPQHIPSVAEMRSRLSKCQWCGKYFKTPRGLTQHQRRDASCQRKKVVKLKFQEGFTALSDTTSMGRIAAELLPNREAHMGVYHWTPMWFQQLIRLCGKENYDVTTPVSERVKHGRWGITERLLEEFDRTKDNLQRQQALEFFYRADTAWRRFEYRCFKQGIRISTSDLEETRATLRKHRALGHTS